MADASARASAADALLTRAWVCAATVYLLQLSAVVPSGVLESSGCAILAALLELSARGSALDDEYLESFCKAEDRTSLHSLESSKTLPRIFTAAMGAQGRRFRFRNRQKRPAKLLRQLSPLEFFPPATPSEFVYVHSQ